MDTLIINGTAKTPNIECNPSGILRIEGRSIPENAVDFYRPVLDWISEYAQSNPKKTVLEVKYEYFNTSSSKCILDIFKRISQLASDSHEVSIVWFYHVDDEDMLEAGEDYRDVVKIPFEIKSFQ